MDIIDIRNPQWADADHTAIDAEVRFDISGEAYWPFTASADDIEEHGRRIYRLCADGAYGEVAAYAAPVIPFDVAKSQKLAELAAWFAWASGHAHLTSSLGFEIDADEVANRDIEGLITAVEAGMLAEPVSFMDFTNTVHPVYLSDLKTMRLEVIANGQALYQQKWALRSAIEAATDQAELDAVVIPAVGGGLWMTSANGCRRLRRAWTAVTGGWMRMAGSWRRCGSRMRGRMRSWRSCARTSSGRMS